ncbi:phenylacetate-coenzyme A ligase domain protein, partial [Ostertagia ostertagi]
GCNISGGITQPTGNAITQDLRILPGLYQSTPENMYYAYGGLGLHYGAEKLGMTVLPISGGGTERQLMLMQDFQSDAICCTPSYALTLAEEIRKQNIDPTKLNLKYAILGAEPWTDSIRNDIEARLGVIATNIYGLSEIVGPGVSQEDFEEQGTGSYIWEDHFYPEIVDKDTHEPLPYGQQGGHIIVVGAAGKDLPINSTGHFLPGTIPEIMISAGIKIIPAQAATIAQPECLGYRIMIIIVVPRLDLPQCRILLSSYQSSLFYIADRIEERDQ